jgi:DNA-binding beta-propeller fold protein YncE
MVLLLLTITAAEYGNCIRFIDEHGKISTIAGTGEEGYSGDGGPATSALLRHPHDVAIRIDREVIVVDSHNGALRRIDPAGIITTIASGFRAPVAVQGGAGNTLFVADGGANAIFKLSPDGRTRRVVGRAVGPFYLAVDERDTLYVSELAGARRVLMIPRVGRTRVLVA